MATKFAPKFAAMAAVVALCAPAATMAQSNAGSVTDLPDAGDNSAELLNQRFAAETGIFADPGGTMTGGTGGTGMTGQAGAGMMQPGPMAQSGSGTVPDLPDAGDNSAEQLNQRFAAQTGVLGDPGAGMMGQPGMSGQMPAQPGMGGHMMSGQMMAPEDMGSMPPGERMALLQARFNHVSQLLAAESAGQTQLSDSQVNQLRQYYTALAGELQTMSAAGIQPQMPSVEVAPSGMTAGAGMQVYTNAEGERFVRAEDWMSQSDTTAAARDYQTYVDEQGVRYYRVDESNRPMLSGMMTGSAGAMGGAGMMQPGAPGMSAQADAGYEVFQDEQGNRYLRVGPDNRVFGAAPGTPMASMDLSGYPQYQDASGNRYVRVDQSNRPMMTSAVQ